MNNGIVNLSVIHRGFSVYEKQLYRNNPNWQIALDLKKELPSIPLLCDPSHISGRRHLIYDIAQKAMDLHYDGLMIETHRDPDNAWSDAAQQITPDTLVQMMKDLRIRKTTAEAESYVNKLDTLRAQIDVIDHSILETLGKRMNISVDIGTLKKEHNVAVLQSKRWNEILGKMIGQKLA